ncbi:hypothetical protein ACLOJK_022768 [Asimina triloba]
MVKSISKGTLDSYSGRTFLLSSLYQNPNLSAKLLCSYYHHSINTRFSPDDIFLMSQFRRCPELPAPLLLYIQILVNQTGIIIELALISPSHLRQHPGFLLRLPTPVVVAPSAPQSTLSTPTIPAPLAHRATRSIVVVSTSLYRQAPHVAYTTFANIALLVSKVATLPAPRPPHHTTDTALTATRPSRQGHPLYAYCRKLLTSSPTFSSTSRSFTLQLASDVVASLELRPSARASHLPQPLYWHPRLLAPLLLPSFHRGPKSPLLSHFESPFGRCPRPFWLLLSHWHLGLPSRPFLSPSLHRVVTVHTVASPTSINKHPSTLIGFSIRGDKLIDMRDSLRPLLSWVQD